MELRIRVIHDDGTEHSIVGIAREDWHGLADPCPECDHREFDHFEATGGHYGQYQGAVIERTDFWDATRSLFTRCRGCGEILYKHPAFDLLFEFEGNDEAVIEL